MKYPKRIDISPISWLHPTDIACAKNLRKLKSFEKTAQWVKKFIENQDILAQTTFTQSTKYANGSLHEVYLEVLERFDAPREYPLFITKTNNIEAFAFGIDNPAIVLSQGLIDLLEESQLRFVLGHELSHILAEHTLMKAMLHVLFIYPYENVTLPFSNELIKMLHMGLLSWERYSELSADRAGLLANEKVIACQKTLMTLYEPSFKDITPERYKKNQEEHRQTLSFEDKLHHTFANIQSTHPQLEKRVKELDLWEKHKDYNKILAGLHPRRCFHNNEAISDQDLQAWKATVKAMEPYEPLNEAEATWLENIEKYTSKCLTKTILKARTWL